MNAPEVRRPENPHDLAATLGLALLSATREIVRLPLLAILWLLGPFVRIVAGILGFLSLFTAALFELTSRLPTRSLVALVAFGVFCGFVLIVHEKALDLLRH